MDFAYNFINPEKGEALAEVKKHHVEMLPISKSEKNNEFEQIIGSLVDQLLQLNKDKQTTSLQSKLDQIQSKIDYFEDKINKIVYELYGLTEEEIKIVEGE